MSERPIDLGQSRLIVSRGLGNEFVKLLESDSAESELVNEVRQYLKENPETHIIGARIEEDENLNNVLDTLGSQMGLPDDMRSWSNLKGRLAGRENILLVVSGLDNFSRRERKTLQRRTKKLNIPNIIA